MNEHKRLLFLFLGLLPIFASTQTFGGEIDTLLDLYFNGLTETADDAFVIDDENDISVKLDAEIRTMALLQQKAAETSQKLAEIRTNEVVLDRQLQTLDAEVSVRADALKKLQSQYESWHAEHKKLKQDSLFLQSLSRVEQRKLEDIMQGAFLEAERLQNNPDWRVMQWLFSEKTASVIQEEEYAQKKAIDARTVALAEVKNAFARTKGQENQASVYVERLEGLLTAIQTEKKGLQRLAEEKSNLLLYMQQEKSVLALETDVITKKQTENQQDIVDAQLAEQEWQQQAEKKALEARKAQENPVYMLLVEEEIEMADYFGAPFATKAEVTGTFAPELVPPHHGIDFNVPVGTEILALQDGVVRKVVQGGLGYAFVEIEHKNSPNGGTWRTVYGHISESLVFSGEIVKKGQPVAKSGGEVGQAGSGALTTGPHLHLEVLFNGKFVNPAQVLPVQVIF